MRNLKDVLQEKALDDILQYAAKEAGEQLNKEYDEMEEIEFSKEHMEKMEKLFKKYRRREQLSEFRKRAGQIVAIFVLAAVLTTGISVFSVQAWRTKFLNFVINITDSNTEIKLEENESNSTTYSSDKFDMNYIPEGFSLSNNITTDKTVYLEFKNLENEFSIRTNRNQKYITNFDSENANVKKVTLNDTYGYFTRENSKNSLLWNTNAMSFVLYGDIAEKEMIKIAENIVIKK